LGPRGTPYYLREDRGSKRRRAYHGSRRGQEEHEIFWGIHEKEVESKTTLEVILLNDPQIDSCALHCPNLGVKVNITKQASLSFSMSKIRDDALYEMFSLSAYYTLFGGSWLIDYGLNYKRHDQGQALTLISLAPPHKYNPSRDV